MHAPLAQGFGGLFGRTAHRAVEYSFDADRSAYGMMVGGDMDLLPAIWQFSGLIGFAGQWAWSTRNWCRAVQPDRLLFRVDWQDRDCRALTLYCRFPQPPDDTLFASLVRACWPFRWDGPPPGAAAQPLGVPGPRGVALRVDAAGRHMMAIYYRVEKSTNEAQALLAPLFEAAGLPAERADAAAAELKKLYRPGPIGVIGLDCSGPDGSAVIKFDPSNVPLPVGLSYVAGKGCEAARATELAALANAFRAVCFSYLGTKFCAAGTAGWRVYFSLEPWRMRSALAAACSGQSDRPSMRFPYL